MTTDVVELRVVEVRAAVPAGAGVEAGMVVLEEVAPPMRRLSLVIGQSEARAIQAASLPGGPSRPSTWDLVVNAVEALGATVSRVVLTAVEERRHWFAVLELDRAGDTFELACRPSDGIALAERVRTATIVARISVLDEAGVLPDGSED